MAGGIARLHDDGATRESKGGGQKGAQGVVGLTLERGRMNLNLHRLAETPDNLAAWCIGHGLHREDANW